MQRIKKALMQRLQDQGMEQCLIPGFIRTLSNALDASPARNLAQVNKQLRYLGWNNFELDYHTLELALTCLKTDELGTVTYKPAHWFQSNFNPLKAA